MPNIERITHYIHNFLYTVSRPRIAAALLSSIDTEKLTNSAAGTKLMTLGALFTSGKLDECIQLADQLDFNDIAPEERPLLALIIFNKFYEHGLLNQQTSNSMKHLLVAICPDELQAHTQGNDLPPQSSLIKLDYAHSISSAVNGAFFVGEFVLGPGTRKSEVGYRIQKALSSHGWNVPLFPIEGVRSYSSATPSDFAMIDAFAFHQKPLDDIIDILSSLRRYFRKIIIVDFDVWAGKFNDMLRSISYHIDYIWGFTADWCLANEPDFRNRCVRFPYFGGFDQLDNIIEAPLDWNTCTFNFTGSVLSYNLNRIHWLLEFIHHRLPIEINISNPEIDDGLDPLQSQHLYAQKLAFTHAAINLTTRKDSSRPATGRSFEVVSLNRLLVQERCPVFHYYFLKGEHFFEFSDIEELCTIFDFLKSHPKTAQTICSLGHQFYKERYSCKKLVEHIQTFL